MYGLLLQAALEFISSKFSTETAHHILSEAAGGGALDGRVGLGRAGFSIHQLYSDKLLIRLAQATADECNLRFDQVMEQFGHFFVRYTHQSGYENLLRVLGRNLSDFVLGLDNLHEYFRGTYPKIKAPSFSVVQEDIDGMTICYRSCRGNLHGYVAGQLSEVARLYYGISITVSAQSQQIDARGKYAVLMRLDFDNNSFASRRTFRIQPPMADLTDENHLPEPEKQSITPDGSEMNQQKTNPGTMFDSISFYLILNRELEIVSVGRGVSFSLPGAMGRDFVEVFELIRPAIPCSWANILDFSNNVFEIHSLQPVHSHLDDLTLEARPSFFQEGGVNDRIDRFTHLRLRGQMIHFEEWDCLIFLAMPIIDTLKELNMLGLKIHDLSMRDSSRELITMRHHRELGKDPLMMQEAKVGNRLDQLHDEANLFRHRRATLLEEAIPRFILRSSDKLTKTHYSNRAAVISCVLSFNKAINSQPVVKELIMTLNALFRKFDNIIAKYSLCKMLTVANEYELIVGVPFHSNLPCNLAMLIAEDLIEAAEVSNDVSGTLIGQRSDLSASRRIRKSIISDIQLAIDIGPVIGTVIAVTVPRYQACGAPVTISQKIAQIAIPNIVTATENFVHELKKNEFSMNYDYKPLVTIQLPLFGGSENIELYTVCSIGRKVKREELVAARNARRRGALRNNNILTSSANQPASTSTSSMSIIPESKESAILMREPHIPKWMRQAGASGEPIPMVKLMAHNNMTVEDQRTSSVLSSTPSRLTSASRSSAQQHIPTRTKEASISSDSQAGRPSIEETVNNGSVPRKDGQQDGNSLLPCNQPWKGCAVS